MIIKEYEWWMILGWSCMQEEIALIECYLGFYCFIMGRLFDVHLYISTFISGAVYIFESVEIQFNTCHLPKSSCVIFLSPFKSNGSSPDMGNKKKAELLILSFYFILIGNGKVLRRWLDTHAALPLPAWAANLHFPGFPHSERRKAGSCSFTAALIGGNPAFPGFLRSERRKSGNCSLTAALIGGKPAFPGFLRSERRKSGNFRLTAVIIGGKPAFSSFPPVWEEENWKFQICCGYICRRSFNPILYNFFPSFMGRGFVPQNEGWSCVNNDWVK